MYKSFIKFKNRVFQVLDPRTKKPICWYFVQDNYSRADLEKMDLQEKLVYYPAPNEQGRTASMLVRVR